MSERSKLRKWGRNKVYGLEEEDVGFTPLTPGVPKAIEEPPACPNFSTTILLPFLFQRVPEKIMSFRCMD